MHWFLLTIESRVLNHIVQCVVNMHGARKTCNRHKTGITADLVILLSIINTEKTKRKWREARAGCVHHVFPEECSVNFIKSIVENVSLQSFKPCHLQILSVQISLSHRSTYHSNLQTSDTNSVRLPIKRAFLPLCLSIHVCTSPLPFCFSASPNNPCRELSISHQNSPSERQILGQTDRNVINIPEGGILHSAGTFAKFTRSPTHPSYQQGNWNKRIITILIAAARSRSEDGHFDKSQMGTSGVSIRRVWTKMYH